MAGNLNLYDFNGSIRRNKLQEAIFSDLAKKEDFMRKINEERIERQERSRRKIAAVKIQSAYRGYRIRKQFHNFLRSLFDKAGPVQSVTLLETQICRLAFFFRFDVDRERTLTLCSEAVILAQVVKANNLLDRRRRQQLLRCALVLLQHTDRTRSCTSALRFFEVFIKEEDCLILLNYGFYSSIMNLFSNCHQLSSPLYIEERLPQYSESLLQILVLPIDRLSKKSKAIYELFDTICKPRFEAITVCCLAPFLARLCKAGTWKLDDVMDALSSGDYRLSQDVSALLISYIVVVITSAFSLEKLNDLEKTKLIVVYASLTQNFTPPPEAMLTERTNNDDSDTEDESDDTIMAAISDVEPEILERITSLCTLTYFIRIHSSANYISLTNLFSSFRQLIPSLWRLIMSLNTNTMFGVTQPLIRILERGENISHSDEQSLIPALSIFITLMTNALKIVDDDDFQNGGAGDTVFPLTLNQVADIVLHCRDLTLGLIDLAFPINSGPFQQSMMKSSKWANLFQDVTLLTKALHERDNRVSVMPHNFWSNHNRNVVVNSSLWQSEYGRRRRARRPFEFVRFLLDNRDSDANEDPPSASELRNLSIIRNIPFVIPFMQRIEIFTELLLRDRIRNDTSRNRHFIAVHRAALYEDAFRALQPHIVPDMKSTIRVQMVNWAGLEEAGVDGGGIFREFLFELLQTALDPSRGFFATTHEQLLYPNPLAPFLYPNNFVDHFYFIGRIIAKLIYEGLLADIRFANFFLLQWMGNPDGTVLDLELVKSYDPLLHKNLKFLKRCSTEEIENLDLDFSVMTDNFGVTEKVELKKDGSCIKVTADNRMEYIQLYVNYYLSKRLSPMIAALRSGLRNVIDPEWLRMFSPLEISMLVGGSDSEIDFNELKKFTTVHNIKSEHDQEYMDLFWLVINEFSSGDKKKLLKFITGCPRPPIMGFKTLTPPMGIQLVHDVDKLPTAATCMNLLKLPLYDNAETLRRKLIYAVNCGAGFELS
uniref:HECT-type E3 ubiquitin transferase n=1 Tax=Wuchereria bancrofti TaxID=6293 RepID=A0AAF5PWG1_WUCBA